MTALDFSCVWNLFMARRFIPVYPVVYFKVLSSKWFIQSNIITGGTNHKSTREKQLKKYINIIRQFITRYSQTQIQTNTIDGLLPCQQIRIYRGLSARPQLVWKVQDRPLSETAGPGVQNPPGLSIPGGSWLQAKFRVPATLMFKSTVHVIGSGHFLFPNGHCEIHWSSVLRPWKPECSTCLPVLRSSNGQKVFAPISTKKLETSTHSTSSDGMLSVKQTSWGTHFKWNEIHSVCEGFLFSVTKLNWPSYENVVFKRNFLFIFYCIF